MRLYSNNLLQSDTTQKSTEENCTDFKTNLNNSTAKHIPMEKISSRWNTPDIKKLCRQKKRRWTRAKKTKKEGNWTAYKEIGKTVKRKLENALSEYTTITS